MPARKGIQKASRHKKKYWRKGTRREGIEEGLDSQREDERLGELSSKSNNDLFILDRGCQKDAKDHGNEFLGKTSKRIMGTAGIKLACFRALEPSSMVKPASVPRRSNAGVSSKTQRDRKRLGVQARSERKMLNKVIRYRDDTYAAKLDALREATAVELADQALHTNYDLWTSTTAGHTTSCPPNISAHIHDHYLRQTRQRGRQRPKSAGFTNSVLPKVELPHPGASYNPDFEDYQDLLSKAHDVELRKKHADDALNDKLMLSDGQAYVTQSDIITEMSEGLVGAKKEERSSSPAEPKPEPNETSPAAPTTVTQSTNKRKTKKQRKHEQRQKAAVEKRTLEKTKNKRMNDVYATKRLHRELKREAKRIDEVTEKRAIRRLKRNTLTAAKLGRVPYVDPDEAVLLTDELVGSLRELKPEGNLLNERWKSLQKRQIIAPSEMYRSDRKHKFKRTEKRSYKELDAADRLPR